MAWLNRLVRCLQVRAQSTVRKGQEPIKAAACILALFAGAEYNPTVTTSQDSSGKPEEKTRNGI
jgi:hypothetical protein